MPHSNRESVPSPKDSSRIADGIQFGSGHGVHTPRQRDRRQSLSDLFTGLTRSLERHGDVSLMRGAFEQLVRRMVPVRTIQLRDAGSRWCGRNDATPGCESIALDVPGPDAGTRGVLEATFDPGCQLGEWDFQMLSLAAHIAALVLEIERNRIQLARAGLGDANRRPKFDRAAPLIGSTPPMEALRTSIKRVAATDFTVLLEGPSDPQ